MTKVTIGIDQLRSLMENGFDWELYEKGRSEARNFAKNASYKKFIENRSECIQRIELCSFEHTPGPSYWVGCLSEFDMVRVPDAAILCKKDHLVLPSEKKKRDDEQAVIRFTNVETDKAVCFHFNKQLSGSQAKDFVEIVNRLMKDNLSFDKQKALFKGLPKFMEKHSLDGYMIPVDTIHMGKEKAYLEKQEEHIFGFVPEDRKGSLLAIEQNGRTNYLYFASRQDEKTLQKIMESMQKDVPNIHGGCISINDIYRVISSCIQMQEDEMKFCGIQMYFAEFGM